MKNVKFITICSFSLFFFSSVLISDETQSSEESRTIVIDGVTYKIDAASLNISINNGENQVTLDNQILKEVERINDSSDHLDISLNNSELSTKTSSIDISANFGQLFPAGANIRNSHSSGKIIGFAASLPKKHTIFNQEFSTGVSLNLGSLSGDNNLGDLKYNTISYHLMTNFEKLPLDFNFGFGYTDLDGESYITGTTGISYHLPFDSINLSINLHLQETFKDFEDTNELWGVSFNYGQSIKWTIAK